MTGDGWDRLWAGVGAAAARNPAQAMRRRLVLARLGLADGPARVIDVGCGQGDLLAELRRRHPRAELAGVDGSRSGAETAAARVPGAIVRHHDLLAPGAPPAGLAGWATHAVCSEVLEHVDDPVALLLGALPLLAAGCRLVVTVPGGPVSAFDRRIGHRRHFSARTLGGVLEAAGFEAVRPATAGFPFFDLYRLVVIARGERLAEDVRARSGAAASLPARLAMAGFGPLLRVDLPPRRWGWQVVATARVPC